MRDTLDNLRVVLVATRNPLNIGAAARAMSNFGARHLRLVRPYDVAFREARSAVGAAELMASANEYGTVAEAVADCPLVVGTTAAGRRELQHELGRLEDGARRIRKQLGNGPVALVFGSEKVGLSNEDMSYCHWLLRIPARAEHGSMNLGQAVAICLYELVRRGKIAASKTGSPTALAADLERLNQLLFDVLGASGYVKPRVATATREKLRRMVRRMNLSAADAEVWLGMLRQIDWKLTTQEARNRPRE
ncbi:MAG: TrmJ/YjtD family RNA methyltransferase [Terriglobales bacterium]